MGSQMEFLGGLESPRAVAGTGWPREWEEEGRVSWLAVEDFGTTGLSGSLKDRKSDFWNYWLNFGLSNKTGAVICPLLSGPSTIVVWTMKESLDGWVEAQA